MKWLKRLLGIKEKRTQEEILLSLMNHGWFLAMYGKDHDKAMVRQVYANLERDTKNGRLEQIERFVGRVKQMRVSELRVNAGGGRPL